MMRYPNLQLYILFRKTVQNGRFWESPHGSRALACGPSSRARRARWPKVRIRHGPIARWPGGVARSLRWGTVSNAFVLLSPVQCSDFPRPVFGRVNASYMHITCRSQKSSGNVRDYGVRGPMFESHHGHLCLYSLGHGLHTLNYCSAQVDSAFHVRWGGKMNAIF